MLGLMYIGASALYLLLTIKAIGFAWRQGRASDGSIFKASIYVLVAVAALYLPVFWNVIPVEMTFRQMCERDAGFKAIVAAHAWREANKDVLTALGNVDLDKGMKSNESRPGFSRTEFIGGLVAHEVQTETNDLFGMKFTRSESRLLDARTDAPLATRINYSVGPSADVRIWLVRQSCFDADDSPVHKFGNYIQQLKGNTK